MAGKMVRHDYLLAASSGVETGADIGVFSVRSPEAKMLDRQQQTNASLAEFLAQQSRIAGDLSAIRGAAHEQIRVARDVGSALHGDLRAIDHHLASGFGQLDSSLRTLDQTVYSGFQGLSYDVRSGFQSLAGVVAAAGDQVSATVGHVGARLDETLQRGFAETGGELRRQGAVGRAHSAVLTAWLGDQLHQGFSHVCDGLRSVDETLVRGFEDTSRTLREEHALDRETVRHIGADIVTAIEDEGAATREAIRAEGKKDRRALAKSTKALTRTLERVIDRVERQGEIRARDHTAAAMRFTADGFHEEALTALGKALDEYQGYFPAHYLRGMVAIQLGRPEDAERFFRMARAQAGSTRAAARGREQALALLMLGRLAAHQGAWPQADILFGDAASADDNLLVAHIEQAHAVLHNPTRGSDPQRTALVKTTLDGLPFAARVLAWLGLALLLAERAPDDAIGALRRGLTLDTRRLTHRRLHLYHALRSLYPALVPHLYAVVLERAPDLAWTVSEDIKR